MKRETFIPIYLGFLSKTAPFWLAEEDTIPGHLDNIKKGIVDHESVAKDILKRRDGENDK